MRLLSIAILVMGLYGCASLEPIGEALQEAAPVARAVPGGGGEALYWILGGLGTIFIAASKVWHSKKKAQKVG